MDYIDGKIAALQKAIDDLECTHPKQIVRYRLTKSGGKMFKLQCTRCGELIGDWIPHSEIDDIANVNPIDDELPSIYRQNIADLERELRKRQRELQKGDFDEWYQEYLQSPEWREKRERVLNRCNGICEGCGKAIATVVHHITYQNVGNEFLFELLGMCKDCHTRYHNAGNDAL
jgi:5-methylcytosine-specific restriction endonuclease McrA